MFGQKNILTCTRDKNPFATKYRPQFGFLRHTKTASFTKLNEMLYHTSRSMRVQRLNLDN